MAGFVKKKRRQKVTVYLSADVGAGLKPARQRPTGGHKALPYTSISWTKVKPEETPELSFYPLELKGYGKKEGRLDVFQASGLPSERPIGVHIPAKEARTYFFGIMGRST